jgi:ubiquinone/menaquinone biosynthesis C-methylase UbiE
MLITLTLLVLFGLGWRYASQRFSLPCPSWLGWLVELENPVARKFNARNIIAGLDVRPGMKVLDAGCGPGRVTVPLARAVGPHGDILAADIQPEMLDRAKEKARAAGVSNVRFVQLGLGEGKLENEQFDRTVLVTVLGEIPDRQAALREIYRALKPGGILSITETVFDPHYQRKGIVRELVKKIGFKERSLTGNRVGFTLNLERPGSSQMSSTTSS